MNGRETNANCETICSGDAHLLPDHYPMVEGREDLRRDTDRLQGLADSIISGGQVLERGDQAESRMEEGPEAQSAGRNERRCEMTDTPTLNEVLALARKLSIDDQRRLVRLLHPPKSLEQLAAEQGVKPFNWDEAQKEAEGIWPEEDSIDEFLAFLRESRKDRRPPRDFGDIDDDDVPGPVPGRGGDSGAEGRAE